MSSVAQIFASMESSHIYIDDTAISILDDVKEEIDSFGRLPAGWDYGRGGPIPEHTLQKARDWSNMLQSVGFFEIEAFPGEQEVLLAVTAGEHYFELIVERDDSISVAYDFKRKQVFYRSHMTEGDAWQTVLEILARDSTETMGPQWSASDYFTLVATTKRNANLPDLHFAIPAMTQDYLLWSGTASKPRAFQLAPTSEHFTKTNFQTLFGNHQSFGNLIPPKNYLPVLR